MLVWNLTLREVEFDSQHYTYNECNIRSIAFRVYGLDSPIYNKYCHYNEGPLHQASTHNPIVVKPNIYCYTILYFPPILLQFHGDIQTICDLVCNILLTWHACVHIETWHKTHINRVWHDTSVQLQEGWIIKASNYRYNKLSTWSNCEI